MKKCSKKALWIWISAAVLAVLFFSALLFFIRRAPLAQDELIAQHIQQLSAAFKKIDADCGIVGFEDEGGSRKKCYIDFLNVKTFTGSEIGALNVLYPDRWHGPYMDDNPTVQERFYYVMRSHNRYYVVPGDGIRLSNGKIIGKDLIVDENSDIDQLINDPAGLRYKDKPLAVKLDLKIEAQRNPMPLANE